MIKAAVLIQFNGCETKVFLCETAFGFLPSQLKAEVMTLDFIKHTVCFSFSYPLRFSRERQIKVLRVHDRIAG